MSGNKHRRAAQQLPPSEHCKCCHGDCNCPTSIWDDDSLEHQLNGDACDAGCCCDQAHRLITKHEEGTCECRDERRCPVGRLRVPA